MRDGHAVSRSSDFIVYSVEAEFIEDVVSQYGPCASFDFTIRQKVLTNFLIPISYQDACRRSWPDISQSARENCVREIPAN